MIKLDVENYCQDCPNFYPDFHQLKHIHGLEIRAETTVFCQYREGCQHAIHANGKIMYSATTEHKKEG